MGRALMGRLDGTGVSGTFESNDGPITIRHGEKRMITSPGSFGREVARLSSMTRVLSDIQAMRGRGLEFNATSLRDSASQALAVPERTTLSRDKGPFVSSRYSSTRAWSVPSGDGMSCDRTPPWRVLSGEVLGLGSFGLRECSMSVFLKKSEAGRSSIGLELSVNLATDA